MKKLAFIYFLLLLSVVFQIQLAGKTAWMPDIILLMIVFEGIFRAGKEAVIFAFIAGLIRGSLSFGTFPVDIFMFPVIGALGFFEGRIFYRHNPIAQALITAVAACLVMFVHTVYLTASDADSIGPFIIFIHNWRTLAGTVAAAPIFFFLMSKLFRLEE
ncbi:MAG: rod shape-determining protein MreD [Candidatus Omnitrophota bacterium]